MLTDHDVATGLHSNIYRVVAVVAALAVIAIMGVAAIVAVMAAVVIALVVCSCLGHHLRYSHCCSCSRYI